jgi:hypothetical protein
VAYKIRRRLLIVAAAPLPDRLSGTALTLLGMFLGLWQSLLYTGLDLAIDVALAKGMWWALARSRPLATPFWRISVRWGLLHARVGTKAARLAQTLWREARTLVMAPQALLRHAIEVRCCVPESCRAHALAHIWQCTCAHMAL